MEVASGLIKLRQGTEQSLDDWQNTMSTRLSEVMESLQAEGVHIESWFQVKIEGENYLLWYMRAESMQKAVEAFQQSTKAIDLFHFEALSAMTAPDGYIMAEPLLNFTNSALD